MSISPRAFGDRRNGQTFKIDGVEFVCWIVDNGHRYEWRSMCGHAFAGRDVQTFWARANGRDLGKSFGTLRLAMSAAANALATKQRGAA